ncbi:MAG TPA: hypothetical protein VKN99_07805 [Polyangia bacterium]|nr:hypothetical protein [Polyangia bacterium]
MPIRTRTLVTWLALALGTLGTSACDSRAPAGPGGGTGPTCDGCTHTQYVLSALHIPTAGRAGMVGCDLNGDGVIDNALGNVLAGLPTVNNEFDFQGAADQAFRSGELVVLFDLGYTPDLSRTNAAELTLAPGQHDPSDGLEAPDFYTAGGRFTVSGASSHLGGQVIQGHGDFAAEHYQGHLPLPMGQPAIAIDLERGHVRGNLSLAAITDGVFCGAIPATEIRDRIVPAVADLISAAIKQGDQTLRRLFDADESCNTDPACAAGASAPCHCVSPQEVMRSGWVRLLDPDLDLDPAVDNPFANRPDDPSIHNDALSFAIGFDARGAQVGRIQ